MKKIPVRHIRSAIKEPDAPGAINICSLAELLAGTDMVQELHRHSFYFILVLEKGAGQHIVDFIPYPVIDRSLFFLRPGQVHQLTLRKNCKGYLLRLADDFFRQSGHTGKQLLKKISHRNYYLPDEQSAAKILSWMNSILQEASEKKEKYEYAIQLNLQLFFVELLRQECSSTEPFDARRTYSQERLEEFEELIAENFPAHKPANWYAEKMHLTIFQLNSIAKTTLGKTSSAIIAGHILLEAKRYLLATPEQVNQISLHLGYEDVSYFIRFFKKHTGLSPEAFRNKFK